jgi:hypothetical protein
MSKATKADSRGGATSQLHRGSTNIHQRSGETQRPRVGFQQQVNLSKWGKGWILELISWDRGQYSKLNYPTLLGEKLTRVAAEG